MLVAARRDVGLPGGSVVKNLPASARDVGSVPGSGRSLGAGNGNLLQPEKPLGWRSLVGYSPWGGKESDMTEPLSTHRRDVSGGTYIPVCLSPVGTLTAIDDQRVPFRDTALYCLEIQ